MGSEKFCLRWNDFESNISTAFRELRDDKDFFDVTLACDDEQIQAHKMILSACSPFFRNILRRNPHQHPLLYLKGVKYTDLQSVLNFMYHGEVNVAQEELNSFLAVAEDLRVKGLTQNQSDTQGSQSTNKENYPQPKTEPASKSNNRASDFPPPPKRPRPPPPSNPPATPHYSTPTAHHTDDDIQEFVPVKSEPRDPPPPPVAQPIMTQPEEDVYSTHQTSHPLASVEDDTLAYHEESYEDYGQYEGQQYEGGDGHQPMPVGGDVNLGQTFQDPSELLQFVRRDPEDRKFYCTICEKFSHKVITLARNHVESQHFPSTFSYPCDLCGEVLTTKSNFMLHRSRKHLNKKNMIIN